jgi:deoxycytidylate deaminase
LPNLNLQTHRNSQIDVQFHYSLLIIKMKTDNYLTLCLEQAAKSPLRYRHGCVIVRGGKVIGQGYNDYRSGFDGGALKTGRLPASSLDGSVIVELKQKHKSKRERNHEREFDSDPLEATTKTFTPFESMGAMGASKYTNAPLSMHSEMMAIHSAISASSTLASTAVSSQKPYIKLSGGSKRKARLQREAIKIYVEIICKAALAKSAAEQHFGLSQVQQWRYERATPQPGHAECCVSPQAGQVQRWGFAQGEKYGETPNDESEERSSQTTAPGVCV